MNVFIDYKAHLFDYSFYPSRTILLHLSKLTIEFTHRFPLLNPQDCFYPTHAAQKNKTIGFKYIERPILEFQLSNNASLQLALTLVPTYGY